MIHLKRVKWERARRGRATTETGLGFSNSKWDPLQTSGQSSLTGFPISSSTSADQASSQNPWRDMYGSRGYDLGEGNVWGGVSDGYEVGSKRRRMMESNPYFAVSSGSSGGYNPYDHTSGFPPVAFPVVRLRGLPFNCTDADIFRFFSGLEIVDLLLVNKGGKFSGDAFVVFSRPIQADLAVQKNRQNMGRSYVEVFKCKKQEYYYAVVAEQGYDGGYYDYDYDYDYRHSPPPSRSRKVKDKGQMEYAEILKLRGLPFTVIKADIIEFFKDFKVAEEKVHIACTPDGKVTGEAYVTFESVELAKQAMSKDRFMIGSRYVELFPSTPDEARRAETRSRQ
ncbi:hypothetical protein L1987_34091 [Smallanthus sonchifolius]|uniref:Uncharacterized protein n=1 Tax=Smallanthus sonchifolius TaxID=185202 RepID=A0ACB9HT95_9ASTR|nr:hypothetical protein L1987_34091 [Smallanthus sonchifolius]